MNISDELFRIAEQIEDEKDKQILISAAIKLLPPPEPMFEDTVKITGYGYHTTRVY